MQGFDEFANLLLEDAEEVYVKKGTRKPIGTIMLKGENVSVISSKEM